MEAETTSPAPSDRSTDWFTPRRLPVPEPDPDPGYEFHPHALEPDHADTYTHAHDNALGSEAVTYEPWPGDATIPADPEPVPQDYLPESTMRLRMFRPENPPSPESTMPLRILRPKPSPDRTGYTLRPVPDSAWSAAATGRRVWVSRLVLACLLVIQVALSLRLQNTAFEDEALYLYAGHVEIGHLLHGTPVYGGFDSYFSGAPVLYPVLAAAVDSLFGLAGARAVSLACMLGCTALLYAMTRRMFNERAGLCAAGVFAIAQSTAFMGNFATYDAPALFLLALAAWITVRTAGSHAALSLLATPVMALAVAVKYASALYLPVIVLLAVLVCYQRRGLPQALLRGALLALLTVGILGLGLYASGYLQAIQSTTTARVQGTTAAAQILYDCARWGGLQFAVACVGVFSYVRRSRMSEMPGWRGAVPGARWRTALGVLLAGSALLAPAYQLHLQTEISLHKHIGYGLLFAAPMAGVGITRLMGPHFKYSQWAILISVVLLSSGMSQAYANYHTWPDSTRLITTLRQYVTPHGHYLADTYEVPVYALGKHTSYRQWNSTYTIDYTDSAGRHFTGAAGFRAAVADRHFDLIVLDRGNPTGESSTVRAAVRASNGYRLIGAVPYATAAGTSDYEIWAKQ